MVNHMGKENKNLDKINFKAHSRMDREFKVNYKLKATLILEHLKITNLMEEE